jgi:uncharacterized DUF497 family protein
MPPSGLDDGDKRPYTILVRIEWDVAKAEANVRTHGVGFPEAATVLEDESALTREDSAAEGEQRFITLGCSALGKLLVVIYTYREPDILRIIAAWKANRPQRFLYEQGLR